jgi:hypothetical protein
MRVLVLGDGAVSRTEITEKLEADGHAVDHCHDPGEAPFPCNGLIEGRGCPLDGGEVEVAVLITGDAPPGADDGARCALRRHIPLVLVGDTQTHYDGWAATQASVDGLDDAIHRAASQPLARHAEAAVRSFRSVLANHELDGSAAGARVLRDGPDLHATLFAPQPLPKEVADMACVRAAGAIRDVDPYARRINVSVEHMD